MEAMWNNRGERPRALSVESLENRTMLSASSAVAVWDDDAVVVLAKKPAPAVFMPAAAKKLSASAATVGNWAGTIKTAAGGAVAAISMKLSTPLNQAVIGTFALGPATGGKKLTSTAVLSTKPDHAFQVIFQGKDFYGSVNATLNANGKQITGRWAYNGAGGWKTGTLVLNKN
jgi:hypothetical protein